VKTQHPEPIIDNISEAIRTGEEFLVLAHVNPDGDAVGSLVALGRVLAALGKPRVLLSPGRIPPEYAFLVASGEISLSLPARDRWDTVFLLDIPCFSRLPSSLSGQVPPYNRLINIDHHASNSISGTLNWVDVEASSVGEMLYRLFERAGYVISADVATPLYAAILTDTGSFRFPNTTASALTAAAQLIKRGADAAGIADRVYGSYSVRKLRLLGEAFKTLAVCCSGRAAFMWVTTEMLQKVGASLLETDGFENFPRRVTGVEVAVLFKEQGEGRDVKVSLRSKKGSVDVSRLAGRFGGGGHPGAAGCIVAGPREAVQEQVLNAVAEALTKADATGNAGPGNTSPEG
jgi:phosphoesterase RecJ-like protein